MFQNRVPHILAGDYTPLSAVNIFVKDLGIVLDYAKKSIFPLPLPPPRTRCSCRRPPQDTAARTIPPSSRFPRNRAPAGKRT